MLIGELAAMGAAAVWAVSMVGFRAQGQHISATSLNLFKNLVGLVCCLVTIVLVADNITSPPWVWYSLVLSGFIGIGLGDSALFVALKRMGAQITAVSQCLSPAMTALIAVLSLGEWLTVREVLAMVVILFGVAGTILSSRASIRLVPQMWGALGFALLSALFNAVGVVIAHRALEHANVMAGSAARVLGGLFFVVPYYLWKVRKPKILWAQIFVNPRTSCILLGCAFGGTFLGIFLMSAGLKFAKAGVASSLNMTYPIWVIPLSIVFLKEPFSWRTLVFSAVAVCGIAMMLL